MARLGTTGRAAATYIILAGLQRGIGLLVLPFVTHAMSPVEYGAASTLSPASLMITAVIAAPLIQLIVRAAARGDENGPALLRVAGLYCYLVLPIGIGLVATVVTLFVPEFLGIAGYIWGIELFAIGLQPASFTFALWVSQAREDLRRFVWLTASSLAVGATLKLLLVVVFRLGVLGWVLTDLIAAVYSAILAVVLVRLPRARVTRDDVGYVLRFSLPLIPHTASLWALTSLSRPVMTAVSTLEQVGLLSFGLNLAIVSSLILAETNRAVLPRFAREVFPAPTRETLEPVKWQLVAAFVVPAIIGSGVALGGHWLFAEAYWPAFALMGILLIGQAAYGLYLIPMNYLTQAAGLPRYSALASGAGATFILISILIFGRKYGAVGVAYATSAGYLAMAVVAMSIVHVLKLEISWNSWRASWPEISLAAGALACSIAALSCPTGSPLVWAFTGGCLVLVIGATVLTYRERERHAKRS